MLITTGGTAQGPADPLRAALAAEGARPVLDGLALRPGGSVLLSSLPSGRRILSLPGNPFAAVVDLLLLGSALIGGTLGRRLAELPACALPAGLQRQAVARAVACVEAGGVLLPVAHQQSGMLVGLAEATHLVLVPGSSEPDTASARALRLPWS
jgi:molybdopterin molybdotransferase